MIVLVLAISTILGCLAVVCVLMFAAAVFNRVFNWCWNFGREKR